MAILISIAADRNRPSGFGVGPSGHAFGEQSDIPTILLRLPELVSTLKTAVHTDMPTSMLPQLASLAEQVGLQHVRSLVFTPPLYQSEVMIDPRGRGYVLEPKVDQIRKAVNEVFSFDPKLEASRQAIAGEGATVRVLNGSGVAGQAGTIRDYLIYRGFDASVPITNGGRADKSTYPTTVITVYNGAEANLSQSVALLEQLFGDAAPADLRGAGGRAKREDGGRAAASRDPPQRVVGLRRPTARA